MPYIYKIINIKNNKIYIGKTLKTIEKRKQEHFKDYLREGMFNRPLYSAMKKYGKENFKIEEVEECSESIINEREQYWIEYYDSFKCGYNATKGGDGKQYADYDLFLKLFNEGLNIKEISFITEFCTDTVSLGLTLKGISNKDKKNKRA